MYRCYECGFIVFEGYVERVDAKHDAGKIFCSKECAESNNLEVYKASFNKEAMDPYEFLEVVDVDILLIYGEKRICSEISKIIVKPFKILTIRQFNRWIVEGVINSNEAM